MPLIRLAQLFAAAGHTLYGVGGMVRNPLLGLPVTDNDVTSSMTPGEVMAMCRDKGIKYLDIGAAFGMVREDATAGRLVAALRTMGFDYIFDTDFSADLTIMEEGSEFLQRLREHGTLPMFTSCCPGWVRFVKSQFPEFTDHLSTAKSPQQMFGAVAKSYYAELLGVEPERIYCVSVMPCLAKKHECALPSMNDAGAGQDVDAVLTTREITRMIRAEHIRPQTLAEEAFDQPLGTATGAGVIFGATGGVMEAALRSAYYLVTGNNPDPDAFRAVRGMDGWREATFDLAGTPLRVASCGNWTSPRDTYI